MNKSIDYSQIYVSNTYGFARSLIAFSLLITLVFTSSEVHFPSILLSINEQNSSIIPNFFHLWGPANIDNAIYVACSILILVISGYIPQITGFLHAWIAYSFFTGALMIEGGDQIGQIIAILLIPVTLLDPRINHWHKTKVFKFERPEWVDFLSYSSLVVIQIQMAVVYFFAVSEKIHVAEWIDGSAFYYWFNHRPFGAFDFLKSMFNPIVANQYFSPLITWGVLILEALLFGALFMEKKYKPLMFKLGISFHLMIIIIHGLWSFFFAMAGGLVIYLLPWDRSINLIVWKKWAKQSIH